MCVCVTMITPHREKRKTKWKFEDENPNSMKKYFRVYKYYYIEYILYTNYLL